MSAYHETSTIALRLHNRGIAIGLDDVNTLRRAEKALHTWGERECGDGNGCIERDEKTGIPYWHNANARYIEANDRRAYSRIPDRETGALKRIAAICQRNNLFYYHQTDPRGCALYVSNEPLTDSAYTNGIAICA